MRMQLPGLDELDALVTRAVDELRGLRTENSELKNRIRVLGKELDDLTEQIESVMSGQKVDSRKRKRIEKRLQSLSEKLT